MPTTTADRRSSKASDPAKKDRLNLALTEAVRSRMEQLRTDIEADSLTEVVRRAMACFDLIVREQKAGGRFYIERQDGKTVEVHFQ